MALSCPLLDQIYQHRVVRDAQGQEHPLHSELPWEYAEALHQRVLDEAPATVLEVGMAYGISSLAILSALAQLGPGRRLISVDPNQTQGYHGVGIANVRAAGFAPLHTLVEAPDYLALPELLRNGTELDLAYIDGWHTFDYVLLDFFYVDRMLRPGGVVGFNDCAWPAVCKAIGFVTSHRKYDELSVRFRVDPQLGRRLRSLARRLFHAPDRYFRKTAAWEPRWDSFAAAAVTRPGAEPFTAASRCTRSRR